MLMIVCMSLSTGLLTVFLLLLCTAGESNENQLLLCTCANEAEKLKTMQNEFEYLTQKILADKNAAASLRREIDSRVVRRARKLKKMIESSQKLLKKYRTKGLSIWELPPLAGYRLMKILHIDMNSPMISTMKKKCMHTRTDTAAMSYAIYLAAALIGYCLLGATLFFFGIGFGLAMELGVKSIIIGIILLIFCAFFGYLPYDGVNTVVQKRAESIQHAFPRVASKLALLTVSGLEVNRAWKLVSESEMGVLYEEMRQVNLDLYNNVSPVLAYTSFIKRCDYVYTTKLATAIMQNTSKGNAEIVQVLRTLNDECWNEYKHNARRMSEKISSKLLIPTMLMFVGILILVIVPVMSGFNFTA